MPIFEKINESDPVVIGGVTVLAGKSGQSRTTPHSASPQWDQASLNGRFLAGEEWEQPVLPAASGDHNYAPSGADAVVYLPAEDGRRHYLTGVAWGYNSAPASGAKISVESPSGVQVFAQPVASAGAESVSFPEGLIGGTGQDVLVRLDNGSSPKHVSLLGRRYG